MSRVMDERSTRVADRLEVPLLVAALLTVPATIIEESHLRHPWPQVATYLNWAIWATFAAEVVVMLVVVRPGGRGCVRIRLSWRSWC